MRLYQPVPFRPYVPSPTLGADKKVMAQTFDEIIGWTPAVGDVIRLTFHGIATYLGVWVGVNGHKVPTKNKTVRIVTIGMAWALAFAQGLGAVADVISLVKRATGTHPPDMPSPKVSDISPIPPVR